MDTLASKKCVPCEGGTMPLQQSEARKFLEELSGWELSENGKAITKTLSFKSFPDAIQFVTTVADIAETEGHHPDIAINYRKVSLILTTHAIGGLSENDFILAAKIDKIEK